MTNKAILNWSRTANGFEFKVEYKNKPLPPSAWGRYQITYEDNAVLVDALFRECDESYRPEFSNDKVVCSDQFIATLTEIEAKQLSLPIVSHAKLKISAEGLISRPGFKLNYRLLRPEGRPFLGATIDGVILKTGAEQQLILDPIYSIIKRIDHFNLAPVKDMDERFVRWGEVQELLPEDSILGEHYYMMAKAHHELGNIQMACIKLTISINKGFEPAKADYTIICE